MGDAGPERRGQSDDDSRSDSDEHARDPFDARRPRSRSERRQLAAAEVTIVVGAGRIRSGKPDQAWRICHAVTTTPREASAQAERTTLSRVRPASELGLLKEIIGHHVCAAQAGECGLPVGVFEEACSLQVVDVTLPTINVAVTDAAS